MKEEIGEVTKENLLAELPEPLTREEIFRLKGPVDIPMTNDYLFRALLQRNNQVLKALICALLHLEPKSVSKVSVENPIELGKSYDEKELILDIKALLNENIIINLEIQVVNEENWIERSLYYLCRSFDNLNKGMDYLKVKPAVQIGILNFSLFPENPEFYGNFYMLNEKSYRKYSDKLRLSVVDLTQIKLATEEDRAYKIDQWAQFFKSKDWGELVMLAQDNTDIQSAVGTVYQLSREKEIRQQCEAREDYYKRERDRQYRDRRADERDKKADERDRQADERDKQADERERMIEKKEQKVEEKEQQIEKKEQQVEEKEQQIERKEQQIEKKEQQVEEKEQQIERKEQQVEEKEQQIEKKEQQVEKKEQQIKKDQQELAESQKELEQVKQSLVEWERKLKEKERNIQEGYKK